MIRIMLILVLCALLGNTARCQVISVDNMLTLSSLTQGRIESFMNRKGFLPAYASQAGPGGISFYPKPPRRKKDPVPTIIRSFDVYRKDNNHNCAFHTTSPDEFNQGKAWLKAAGFIYDRAKDSLGSISMIYQKKIFTVWADSVQKDTSTIYTLLLQRKELPDPSLVHSAEDLVVFESNELLATYFGEENVKKDVYYFSENQLKKCSILFPNTNRQAIFVWEDETNLRKLSYILISGIAPTQNAVMYSTIVSQNKWTSRQGLCSGMSLRELVRRNGEDFSFFGPNSEFAFMVEPKQTGFIDFKKTGIMLGCLDCSGNSNIEQPKISATEAMERGMTLYIFYIMISP